MVKRLTPITPDVGTNAIAQATASTLPPSALGQTVADIDIAAIRAQSKSSSSARLDELMREGVQNNEQHLEFTFDNVVYDCDLVVLEPDEIQEATVVHSLNDREQKWLTALALADIIPKLKLKGQIYPALAFRCPKTSKIIIIDGSRRRMGCYFARTPYKIYVSRVVIPDAIVKELSEDSNTHKEPSIIERGRSWKPDYIESGLSLDKFSLSIGQNKSKVFAALKSTEVPEFIFDGFPSPSDIGRTSVLSIHKLIVDLTNAERSKLQQLMESEPTKTTLFLKNIKSDFDAFHQNKLFLTNFTTAITTTFLQHEDDTSNELVSKPIKLKGIKGKVIFEDDGSTSIELKTTKPQDLNQLISELTKLAATHPSTEK